MPKKLPIKELVKENLVKNLIVVMIALIAWPSINSAVQALNTNSYGNLLTVISILLVTVCFANFAFSYDTPNIYIPKFRFLSHLATFLFLVLTALLLILMSEIIKTAYPSIGSIVWIFSATLYFSVIIYDFWDLLKTAN